MPYARTDVRQALSAAREAGKPVQGLNAGDRETVITLEKWGYLPVNQDALDKRIQDWYVSQGLATREGDTRGATSGTPDDTRGDTRGVDALDVLQAAESALETARVALSIARSMAGGGLPLR